MTKYSGLETLDDCTTYEEFETSFIRKTLIQRIEDRINSDPEYKEKEFKSQVSAYLGQMVSAYNHLTYAAWYAQAAEDGTMKREDSLEVHNGIVSNLYVILPYREACFCCHRPVEVHVQDDELHNENGMAVKYADGLGWYSLFGLTVDEKLILHPELQTLDEINGEDNITIKRERIKRYGWLRYLQESEAEILDESVVQGMETLFRVWSGYEELRILMCHDNSTQNLVPLEVSTECMTCAEAQRYLQPDDETLALLGLTGDMIEAYPVVRT